MFTSCNPLDFASLRGLKEFLVYASGVPHLVLVTFLRCAILLDSHLCVDLRLSCVRIWCLLTHTWFLLVLCHLLYLALAWFVFHGGARHTRLQRRHSPSSYSTAALAIFECQVSIVPPFSSSYTSSSSPSPSPSSPSLVSSSLYPPHHDHLRPRHNLVIVIILVIAVT